MMNGRLDIAGYLLLDALAGQRTVQFGHHDRVAPHPHIRADVAKLNIPQTHSCSLPVKAPPCLHDVPFGFLGRNAVASVTFRPTFRPIRRPCRSRL
jgi:hypothetical protein